MTISILAVGDVCGAPGLTFLENHLRTVRRELGVSFVVVNGENANVVGVTPQQCDRILAAGADVITLGNHTWVRWELRPYLADNVRVLRPINYAPQCPGRGFGVYRTPFGEICVINALGRFTLDNNTDNPFVEVDCLLKELDPKPKIILVDMHAEATSERLGMGYFLDGRVSAVWGTHTHVQTSDADILPKGTGYISDLGMTGASHSVLGIDVDQSINKFLGDPPRRYRSGDGPGKMECCLFDIDTETGRCVKAEAMRIL
ncbi:MAG: YmdB family metallophosphoesterase [Oscillospiraceae bacterium]|nr:YmdB family metallophosphoesterase [Oscillospiraceae bacterium]